MVVVGGTGRAFVHTIIAVPGAATTPSSSGRCPRPPTLSPTATALATGTAAAAAVLAVGVEAVPAAAAGDATGAGATRARASPFGRAAPTTSAASTTASATPAASTTAGPTAASVWSVAIIVVVITVVIVAVVRSVRRRDVGGRLAQPSDLPIEVAILDTRAVHVVRCYRQHSCRCRACHATWIVVVEGP